MNQIRRYTPNFLSTLRILLCPICIFLFQKKQYPAAMATFFIACFTDLLDGFLAKRWRVQSHSGSFLDPIADKFFTLSLFTLLMVREYCPAWFLGFQVAIAVLQVVGFLLLKTRGAFVPIRIGKIQTAIQFAWLGLLLFDVSHSRFNLPEAFLLLGYSALTSLQTLVFFRYAFRTNLISRLYHQILLISQQVLLRA